MPSKTKTKKRSDDASPRLGQPSDAVSLRTGPPLGAIEPYRDAFSDDDENDDDASTLSYVGSPRDSTMRDPPPLYYTDDPGGASAAAASSAAAADASAGPAAISALNPILPAGHESLRGGEHPPVPSRTDGSGNEIFLDRRLDQDPTYLEHAIRHLALFPPRPHVRLRGTHTETSSSSHRGSSSSIASSNGGGGSGSRVEHRTVVDFDVRVDLTPFLYRDIDARRAWRTIRTVGNFDKVRRGTVWETRAPGFGGAGGDPERSGGSAPSLREWCHRYCASHCRLKTMLILRRVTGLDEDLLRQRLETLVRAARYRGALEISFPVDGARVEILSSAAENRWRIIPWVRWLFFATFLWLFAWPYLFFRTARFEVVTIDWAFSRPAGRAGGEAATEEEEEESSAPLPLLRKGARREFVTVGEEVWYNMWARAIRRAVLERRRGVLDQADLRAAQDEAGPPIAEGVGGGGGALAGLVHAMGVVDRQFGWGANH